MNINVGDYFRNKYGIAKVLEISEDVVKHIQIIKFDRPICFLVNPKTGEEINRTNILPITTNIDLDKIKIGKLIDLIEVGDYVNGHLVKNRRASCNENLGGHPKQVDIGENKNNIWISESKIKSIVTKEQMEAMEYKIER